MIRTKRFQLVKFDVKYAEDLYELWGDFEVIKYTYMPQMHSTDECVKKIEMFIEYTDKQWTNNFIILLDNKAIGIVGAPVIDESQPVLGLYYQLARNYWGNGYISEAVMALKDYIMKLFPQAKIHAEVVARNHASIKILKKIGFKEVEVEVGGFALNGLKLDLHKFESTV